MCLSTAQKEDSQSKLAVAERETGKIHIYDVRSGSDDALHSFEVHRTPVVAMRYNAAHDSVVSVDQRGTAFPTRAHDLVLAYTAHISMIAVVQLQPSMRRWTLRTGMIEYWSAKGYGFPEEDVDFSTKMDTDLYALPKAKALPQSLELSSDGTQFAIWSSDRCILIAQCTQLGRGRTKAMLLYQGGHNGEFALAIKAHTPLQECAVQAGPGVLV